MGRWSKEIRGEEIEKKKQRSKEVPNECENVCALSFSVVVTRKWVNGRKRE